MKLICFCFLDIPDEEEESEPVAELEFTGEISSISTFSVPGKYSRSINQLPSDEEDIDMAPVAEIGLEAEVAEEAEIAEEADQAEIIEEVEEDEVAEAVEEVDPAQEVEEVNPAVVVEGKLQSTNLLRIVYV